MLIQGLPDILKPPPTALLNGLDVTQTLSEDETLANYAWLASVIPLSVVDKIEVELTGSPDWLVGLRIFKLYAVPYELEMPMIMSAFGMDPAESVAFLDEIMDRSGVMYELLKKPNIESRDIIQAYADKHGWTDDFIASVGRISLDDYQAWVSESQASPSEPPFAGGITVPSDLGQRSIGGKVEWYRRQRESFTDLQVRMAVERFVGPQTDEDWNGLKYLSNIPPYIITSSPTKKAAIYRSLLQRFDDVEIRRMVSLVIGPQSESDWDALVALASRTPALPQRVVEVVAAPAPAPAVSITSSSAVTSVVVSPSKPDAVPSAVTSMVTSPVTVVTPTVVDTTARNDGVSVPLRLDESSMAAKVDWYKAQRAAGFSDVEIRAAVERVFGAQLQSDWTVLVNAAMNVTGSVQTGTQTDTQSGTAGPGAGALLAIAAAALAYLS